MMKRLCLVIWVMLYAGAAAQYWPNPTAAGRWIDVRALNTSGVGDNQWEITGGIGPEELIQVGLQSIGSGREGYAYFIFSGMFDEDYEPVPAFLWDWPPSRLTTQDEWRDNRSYRCIMSSHSGNCSCDCLEPTLDTLYLGDGFGFWINDPEYPENFWGINHGYMRHVHYLDIWRKMPCPPAGNWHGKPGEDPIYFTDSTWVPLDTGSVLSGDSKLYIKAELEYGVQSLPLKLWLRTSPDDDTTINMTYVTDKIWHATILNSKILGLKSYNTMYAKTIFPGTDSVTWGLTSINVALPQVLLKTDSTFVDTIFIRSDSMKVAKDPKVSLRFINDGTTDQITTTGLVDSAAYKYKSRWTANKGVRDATYHRQFPSGTTYRKWNNIADDCQVTFNRDSLYVVGGLLTIECRGKLKPIYRSDDSLSRIDNSFKVVTDSITAGGDTLTINKRILIDKDPINALFSDSLETDQARAIAWHEHAGWGDTAHCHNPDYQPPWNHYWDDKISGADTCRDSKTPCENTHGTATGIMQIVRTQWERFFNGSYLANYPSGWKKCKWDSLAWNWQININNGKWIFEKAMPSKMTSGEQPRWPDSCACVDCDSVPDQPNKEDLANYGFHVGEGANGMGAVKDSITWHNLLLNAPDGYCKFVRRYKYNGTLW